MAAASSSPFPKAACPAGERPRQHRYGSRVIEPLTNTTGELRGSGEWKRARRGWRLKGRRKREGNEEKRGTVKFHDVWDRESV